MLTKEEVTGRWKMLNYGQIRNLCSAPRIHTVVKTGHVVFVGEMRSLYKVLIRISKGNGRKILKRVLIMYIGRGPGPSHSG